MVRELTTRISGVGHSTQRKQKIEPEASASGNDGIIRIGCTLFPETKKERNQQKINKIYDIVVFETLDLGQQRTVVPKRWKINKLDRVILPAYCFENVSRLRHREEETR